MLRPAKVLFAVKSLIPSMFHRRLLLLLGLIAGSVVPLAGQLGRLGVVKADTLRADAERRLSRIQFTPTVRGSILDRKGRVLAQDRPSYDIAVAYPVINGDWARQQAQAAARRAAGAGWVGLKTDERDELTGRLLPAYLIHLERAWDALASTVGVSRTELDARRDAVIAQVSSRQDFATRTRRERDLTEAIARGDDLTDDFRRSVERRAAGPIAEVRAAHVLANRVNDAVGFACQALANQDVDLALPPAGDLAAGHSDTLQRVELIPGLEVRDGGDRDYPYETLTVDIDQSTLPGPLRAEGPVSIQVNGLACHLLGRMRDQVHKEDAAARAAFLATAAPTIPDANRDADRGAYRDGDHVGEVGLEAASEHTLRGLRGRQTARLDTGEVEVLPPTPGVDVRLTLDIMLQARVQAAMSPDLGLAKVQEWHHQESLTQKPGDTLYGAAIVLDVDTGDVLAMVSTPTYTRETLRTDPGALFDTTAHPDLLSSTPWLNRAIDKPYQPGSIVKPLLFTGAVERGNIRADGRIECTGHLFPERPGAFRCWIYKRFGTTHTAQLGHDPDGVEAIMASCNIFFFTLGRRLGPDGIRSVYEEFGLGALPDLGVAAGGSGEFAGTLGLKGAIGIGDAIQMGIGQGPVAWTPLHAADAYATLARHGARLAPRLVIGRPRQDPVDLALDPRAVAVAMEGLGRAVGDDLGTGHAITFDGVKEPIFNAPGVRLWGKTGTAAASPVVGDPDGEGPSDRTVLESGDHSWFVVLVGRDRPRYAISVVIDFGGSGGKVSGPITNQIVHALIAEGYL